MVVDSGAMTSRDKLETMHKLNTSSTRGVGLESGRGLTTAQVMSPSPFLLWGLVLSLSPALGELPRKLCGPVNNCVLVPVVLPSAPANGDIRLANSDGNRLYGVLYIYLDGQWGTISYEGFTISAANVACRQLGQVGAENYTSIGQNSNALLPDNV